MVEWGNMKAVKTIIGKIILIIVILIILSIINSEVLNKITPGITLPVGWSGGMCYQYEYSGFPFSVLSFPPPGMNCSTSFNVIGSFLNFAFLVLLTYIFYIILGKIVTRK